MNPISRVNYKNQTYDIFDAGYSYNVSRFILPNINNPTEVSQLFTVPSIRFFYTSKKINLKTNKYHILPYLGNTMEDIILWRKYLESDFFNVTIYSQTKYDYGSNTSSSASTGGGTGSSASPEDAFYAIVDGDTIVSVATNYLKEYIRKLLIELNLFNRDESLELINREQNTILNYFIKGGFNPASDYIRAIPLAFERNETKIQEYLDEIGIITFTASQILNLQPSAIFFYLVHFFGVPYVNNLNVGQIIRPYQLNAKTPYAKIMIDQLEDNYDRYVKGTVATNFAKFFNYANAVLATDNRSPQHSIQDTLAAFAKSFGTTVTARIQHNIFDYLVLLDNQKPETLSLKLFKKLCTANENVEQLRQHLFETLLNNYTDEQLSKLIPAKIGDLVVSAIEERDTFIYEIIDYWILSGIRIMNKNLSDVCFNSESLRRGDDFKDMDEPYLGVGSLSTQINCYTFDDVLSQFVSNTDADGFVTFIHPIGKNQFTKEELMKIKRLVQSEVPEDAIFLYYMLNDINSERPENRWSKEKLLSKLNDYIATANLQESADFESLRTIQRYARESSENRTRVESFFMAMFELGLYFRQWQGPGTAYPLTSEIQMEPEENSDREVALSQRVTDANTKFDNLFNEFPDNIKAILNDIIIYIKYPGATEPRQYTVAGNPATLQRIHNRVKAGYECIRMSSGPYFYTAAYYLKKLLNVDIPGFPLSANIQQII